MDSKQMKIAAVAAVLVIVVAAVAVYFVTKDKDNGSDESKVTFLIQDNVGVYFWAEGSGDTVLDALKDACEDYDIKFVASNKDGVDTGIQSLFGLEMKEDAGKWSWWAQYGYVNNAWESSTLYMNELKSEDNAYFALVYGDGSNAPAATPKDAKAWNFDTAGTTFLIQSQSGMEFSINGEGKTVLDALKDAATTYSVPIVYSKDAAGTEYGIDAMFGLSTNQDSEGNWHWWNQSIYDEESKKYVTSDKYMSELMSEDNAKFCLSYA